MRTRAQHTTVSIRHPSRPRRTGTFCLFSKCDQNYVVSSPSQPHGHSIASIKLFTSILTEKCLRSMNSLVLPVGTSTVASKVSEVPLGKVPGEKMRQKTNTEKQSILASFLTGIMQGGGWWYRIPKFGMGQLNKPTLPQDKVLPNLGKVFGLAEEATALILAEMGLLEKAKEWSNKSQQK